MHQHIIVNKHQVTYTKGSSIDPVIVDFSVAFNAIKQALKEKKLIAIEGRTGSGKSGLAQVLSRNLSNSQLIDAGELSQYQYSSLELSNLNPQDVIYIIDDISYVTEESLISLLSLIKTGKNIILLMSSKYDLPQSLRQEPTWFSLHSNLSDSLLEAVGY